MIPTLAQKRLLRKKDSLVKFIGGVGAGKTEVLCALPINKKLINNAGFSGVIMCETYQQCRQTIWPVLERLYKDHRLNEVNLCVKLNAGGTIYVIHNRDHLRMMRPDYIAIDNGDYLSPRELMWVTTRLNPSGENLLRMTLTFDFMRSFKIVRASNIRNPHLEGGYRR